MCGIVASIPGQSTFLRAAIDAQISRGPDETTVMDVGFAMIGINRLSISGIEGGSQPLSSPDGRIQVVFNGAIYNVERLKREFGLNLGSKNDGEVIAPLYERFGLQFADYLEGMFAICIADSNTRRLVVAVDPIGIKPLYYLCSEGGAMSFASDLRSFPPEMRRLVSRVPAGTILTSEGEWRRIARIYWNDGDLLELLRVSVREQIPQEVSWGCMLSGGLDSSLIVQLASEIASPVQTITCGFRNGTDMIAGRRMAERVNSIHQEVLVDREELIHVVKSVVAATASMEPWTVMGGVGTYLVAREARRLGIKVLLSGEGADELFGGYDEFQPLPDIFLDQVLLQYQADLGVTECLRLDRCTMANSVEARVPFLCTSVIRHARACATSSKIHRSGSGSICKYALRVAAAKVMPGEFADRTKEEFSNGSGISIALREIAEELYPPRRLRQLASKHPTFGIVSPAHAWFFAEWLAQFGETIGLEWPSLVQRGLYRQSVSRYSAVGAETAGYGPAGASKIRSA